MRHIIFLLTIFSLLLLTACKKVEVNGDFADQGVGSYVTKVALGCGIMDYSNISNAKVDATVREYGSPVDKIKIFVTKGNATTDNALWKAVKEVPYNGDTKLEVSANEIATALGIPVTGLTPGTSYTLYNQVISKDGQVHDITTMNSAMYGSPNYNTLMTWSATVICPFTGNMTGTYKVITDEWVDWSPGDLVQVTDGPGANQVNLSQVWPNPAYGTVVNPLVVNVTQATGAASIPSGLAWGDYGSIAATGTGSSGYVFSCTGDINLRVRITYAGSDYGSFALILKKQ